MDDWAGGEGAELSQPSVDTSRWLPATVPGTVLSSLVSEGHLPDPVAGFANLHIPEALSHHSWWYRREFSLPKGLRTGAGRRVWLEFDGVNHEADVWLNGKQAGTLTFPFARAAYDVTALLAADGAQALAVRISPMPFPGSPGDKGPAGLAFVDAGANMMNRNSPTYLASSGWDWMPAVRDRAAGIWNRVRLRSTGDVVLGDPRVDTTLPDLPDTRTAEVTVVVPVRNAASDATAVTVAAAFDGVRVRQTVTVPGGESAGVVFSPASHAQLRLRDPKLWWPNGYGEPELHRLTLTASVAGQESDRRTTRFGLRQFGYEYDVPLTFQSGSDAYAQTVTFARRKARYVRVLCRTRATDWGSSMWGLSVADSSVPDVDLALHKEAASSSVDDGMRAAVRAEPPGLLYQNNSAGGIVSGGGPYGWVEPERYYSASTYGSGNFGFHTEIGTPVVSTAETMRRLAGDEPECPSAVSGTTTTGAPAATRRRRTTARPSRAGSAPPRTSTTSAARRSSSTTRTSAPCSRRGTAACATTPAA